MIFFYLRDLIESKNQNLKLSEVKEHGKMRGIQGLLSKSKISTTF